MASLALATSAKRYFVIHVGGHRRIRYCCQVPRCAPDDSERRHVHPPHAFVTMMKARRFQPDNRIAIGITAQHSIVMSKQRSYRTATGLR